MLRFHFTKEFEDWWLQNQDLLGVYSVPNTKEIKQLVFYAFQAGIDLYRNFEEK